MPRAGVYRVGGTRASVSPRTYTFDDFEPVDFSANTRTFNASRGYEMAYELDIEDGIGEWMGRGRSSNPLQAQGFAGLRLVSDAAAAKAEGDFRIAVRNAQGRRLYNIARGDLATYDLFSGDAGNGTVKDRKNREPFPNAQSGFETEPHKISIDLNVSSDISIDNAEDETRAELEGYQAESLE